MNALQPQRDPLPARPAQRQVQQPVQRRSRSHSRQRQAPHQTTVIETSLKLIVNLIFGLVAATTLAKLIPHNLEQQADLERLRGEVKELGTKVASLEEDFDRHFDPQQALNVMQEQNIRFNPKQKQVVWLTPNPQKLAPESEVKQADLSEIAPD
jgi:hypothetical protein